MLAALGVASTAIDALKKLTSSVSSSVSTGFGQGASGPFGLGSDSSPSGNSAPVTGFSGAPQISPATMSALLAAQSQAGSTSSAPTSQSGALQDLFSQIDANGDGQITKSEFENALGAGGTNLAQADDVFSKLDTNGDGSVSLGEMSAALKGAGGKGGHHHHAHVGGSTGSGAGNGAGSSGTTSTSVTNSNGSVTTSLTYADGSNVSMTSPPATTSSSAATASYNSLEQLIQRAAQAVSFSPTSLSFSA
jgi:hypothetical protein